MKKLIAFFGLALAGGALQGAIVYSNGTPDYAFGNSIGNDVGAESFEFSNATAFSHVMFQALNCDLTQSVCSSLYNTNIYWAIAADNSGTPGMVIASGNVTPTPVELQSFSTYFVYQYDFDIPTFLATSGTTYWLELHNGPQGVPNSFGVTWTGADSAISLNGEELDLTMNGATWTTNSQEHFFQLSTPEPSSWLLMAAGLGAVALVRRKRAA